MSEFEGLVIMGAVLFAAFWRSPRALSWAVATMLARREALRTQKIVMRWHLARLDAE